MTFARLHKAITYATALLGLLALAVGGVLGAERIVLLAIAILATWWAEPPRVHFGSPRYARAWNAVLLAFVGLGALRLALGEEVFALVLELSGLLLVSRLASRSTAREHAQVAVLAFLQLIAATVLSTGAAYGVVFVGFVVVLPWMLALTHLRSSMEADLARRGATPDERDALLARRDVVGPGFLAGTASLAVPLFLVTATFFFAFPRVGLGMLSFGAEQGASVAGFGANVELGGFGTIRDDPTVVVRVRDANGREPPRPPIRLRGTSFSRYESGTWTRARERGESIEAFADDRYVVALAPPEEARRRWEIVLAPIDEPVVFLPPGTIALRIPPRMREGIAEPRRLTRSAGLDLRYDADGIGLLYEASIADEPYELVEPLDEEELAAHLALPRGSERVVALAREIVGDATDVATKANRIEAYLARSGRYGYTLEQPDTRGRDPLEIFLFEAREGHCEYFSTAMAILLRAAGVPSRNVTGFLGGEPNPFGNYVAVRQGDAHSWVEAYVGGSWRTYDPTPPSRAAFVGPSGVVARVRALLDLAEDRWMRWVVGYDLRDQVEGARQLWRWVGSWSDGERVVGFVDKGAQASDGRTTLRDGSIGTALAVAGLAIALGATVLAAARGTRRRRVRSHAQGRRLLAAIDRAFRRIGRPRPTDRTPSEHARKMTRDEAASPELVRAIALYGRARFGGESFDRGTVREVEHALRRSRPLT